MAYDLFDPIAIGSANWGTPVNNAFENIDRAMDSTQLDQDYVAWSWDSSMVAGTSTMTSGTVFTVKVWIRQPATVTNIAVGIGTPIVGGVAGQNFLGLYNSSGVRIGVTADLTAFWATAGHRESPLTAPVAVTPDHYYVAILSNAGTTPAFARGGIVTASFANGRLTAANARYATGPAAQTTLPASITLASRTLSANPHWVGLS